MSEDLFPDGAALVIGGSGGIGRVIARRFAANGTDVAVTYLTREAEGKETAKEAEKHGRRGISYSMDVTKTENVTATVAAVEKEFGRIHTVVFAAGTQVEQRFINQIPPERWRSAIEVETFGLINVVHATLPHFRTNKGGSYVHLSSSGQTAWATLDGLSVVPKAANDALLRGIAKEEGRYGIRANIILVGVIEAGMFLDMQQSGEFDEKWQKAALRNLAIKRWGKPEEVGDTAVFLASNKAGYITGQAISVSGGYGL